MLTVLRSAQHNLITSGNPCRQRKHQHCGEQRCPTSGDIQSHTAYRHSPLHTGHTGHCLTFHRSGELSLMERRDILGSLTYGFRHILLHHPDPLGNLIIRDRQ